MSTRPIGFSSGALAKADFRRALELAREAGLAVFELSALRRHELRPMMDALGEIEDDLAAFRHVTFHAPSAFEPQEEAGVVELLTAVHEREIPLVVHPDVIYTPARWRRFGGDLWVENMDVRKPLGQTCDDLEPLFAALPEARLCLDLAHARQVDPTLGEAERLLLTFAGRLAEIHLSHVDTDSRHHRLTPDAVADYQDLAALVPAWVPVVLETPMGDAPEASEIRREVELARNALSPG